MDRLRRVSVPAIAIYLTLTANAVAQTASAGLKFEVASVRPALVLKQEDAMAEFHRLATMVRTSGRLPVEGSPVPVIHGSRVDMENISKKDLIAIAYGVDRAEISRAPGLPNVYLQRTYYIRALMPEGATRKQLPEMVRNLLEERFHLKVHRDFAERPVYALVQAKNVLHLDRPGEIDRANCDGWRNNPDFDGAQTCIGDEVVRGEKVTTTFESDSQYGPWKSRLENNAFRTEFVRITMPQLASYLTRKLSSVSYGDDIHVPVVDRTGIDGEWDVVLDRAVADPTTVTVSNSADAALDSFTSSLNKLGLKLERAKAPIEELVVDQMDNNPTEN